MSVATQVFLAMPMRRSRYSRRLLAAALMLHPWAPHALAAENPTTGPCAVELHLPNEPALAQAAVRIYRWEAETDRPVQQTNIARQSQTRIEVSLPAGRYTAEIGAATDTTLALLRSAPFIVPRDTSISLRVQRLSCGADIQGSSVAVRQAAVRRLGDGEVRWKATASTSAPTLLLSPDEPYGMSCVAESKEAVLALWSRLAPPPVDRVRFSDEQSLFTVSFHARSGTPALAACDLFAVFPDTTVTLSGAHTGRRLLTNRDRALLGYELRTAAGETVRMLPRGCRFTNVTRFEFGGPLQSFLYAGFGWSETDHGWKPQLITRVDLADPGGHLLDAHRSKLHLSKELFYTPRDGGSPQPLAGVKPPAQDFKAAQVSARLRYTWGGQACSAECRGEGFKALRSEHFRLSTPPAWEWRGRLFLACLEEVRRLTLQNTGRPGPESFKVDWRMNGNNAKSIVGSARGGGHDLWMSFPFWTLESFSDPFVEPWFGNHDPYVCHETLHTFGYNHGRELSRLEWLGEAQYRSLRWQAVDTGLWAVWAE